LLEENAEIREVNTPDFTKSIVGVSYFCWGKLFFHSIASGTQNMKI
jgi:hypothetical protein